MSLMREMDSGSLIVTHRPVDSSNYKHNDTLKRRFHDYDLRRATQIAF